MTDPVPFVPSGEEREVKYLEGATIDGAPVAYIIVLAAVVAALSFIPFSVVLFSGGSFPMSQGVYPLVGWLLGPIAGAVAGGVGSLLGVFLAPHTAGIPLITISGAAFGALVAGAMGSRGRRPLWPWVLVFSLVELGLYLGRAILHNGIHPRTAILSSAVDWSAVLLFALPTRTLCARWIGSPSPKKGRLVAGLLLGTWMGAGMAHLCHATLAYYLLDWPEPVWVALIPIIPIENLARCLIGVVIGSGVITGLRAIGLVKARRALY
jgi:hypothetical protein